MTATPRLYAESAVSKAKEKEAVLCSMDDTSLYGEEMYRIGFGEAVEKQLLSDYKVIVLTLDSDEVSEEVQDKIEKETGKPITDDNIKLLGCINALSKITKDKELFSDVDPEPMHSAVAFCENIAISKKTVEILNKTADIYKQCCNDEEIKNHLITVEAQHVDGSMGANERTQKLTWLKSAKEEKNDFTTEKKCNILMNVRCLSEGVDVPSLDAVLFLSRRNSQVDIVQSVGRVMRKSEGKKYGYIIIPVVVKMKDDAAKILNDSEDFKIVWTVLNALRAHDDRFNATINKLNFIDRRSHKPKPKKTNGGSITVTGTDISGRDRDTNGTETIENNLSTEEKETQEKFRQMELAFEKMQEEMTGVVYAKIVEKCGERTYWEQWAKDVAKIAERHVIQINKIIEKDEKAKQEFEKCMEGLHKNINPMLTKETVIEMLAQHIITKPVFEALFENYSFAKNNPVSASLENIVRILNEKVSDEDNQKLEGFYRSVRQRVEGIDSADAKQKIIIELYDKFFKTAFPKVVEELGIVYTPVEVVDFIIQSVEDVLQKDFGRSLTDENIHILDPFTGTGTFITRLLQSEIIKKEDLLRKYTKEIHANEIILLAYYIASINIENVFHDLIGENITQDASSQVYKINENAGLLQVAEKGDGVNKNSVVIASESKQSSSYIPFDGICLTDTFQLGETEETQTVISEVFPENSERVVRQKKAPIRVIIGNPPYSIGQKSANDNAQNQNYPHLNERIEKAYVQNSSAALNKSAYNSYIKAFRWASDRIQENKDGGIVAFITGSGWLGANGLDGFRKALDKEFDKIYVYNLRGNIRGRSGESAKKEGQNVFNIMTGVAVTVLVKLGEK